MNAGDLLEWVGARYLVYKVERISRSAILIDVGGGKEVVSLTLDETSPDACKVLCNPPSEWPFVTLPSGRHSRLQNVVIPDMASGERVLAPFVDWVRLDPLQIGGPLFLNPALRLGHGHIILGVFGSGTINIRIPKNFGSHNERAVKAAVEATAEPKTMYDRLLGDDFDDD